MTDTKVYGRGPFLETDGDSPGVFDPELNQFAPMRDRREEMKRISENYPTSEEEKATFLRHERADDRAVASSQRRGEAGGAGPLAWARRAAQCKSDARLAVYGDVGFGVFYKSGQLAFANFSILYHYILGPATLGGDVNNFFYLTATNRTAKGVEAFLCYYKQENPFFKVYDWSKPESDRWSLSIPFAHLSRYFTTVGVGGHQLPAIHVINATRLKAGTTWVNEVLLFDQTQSAYDFVYSHEYTLGLNNEQRDSHYGSWGPIVETFQQFGQDTNILGFRRATLLQDDVFHPLTAENSDTRNDGVGIKMLYLDPNHTYLAN